MGSEEGKKALLCVDALNWLSLFWNFKEDLQHCEDPWTALRSSDEKVGRFVDGARSAGFELVVVVRGGAKDREVQAKYKMRRENEILHERKGVCLGADLFLAESFRSRGIRVVKPIGADTNDVIAAIAVHSGSIVVSGNSAFAHYDKPLVVSRNFTVKKGKLLVEEPRTQCNARWGKSIERALALHDETWCGGHENKYRGSLRINRQIEFGSSSSSDRRMGNLHAIARPLRAAVYAVLGEGCVLERIPEWSKDEKMVVWTETTVSADDSLVSVVHNPIAAVEWLVIHDNTTVEEEYVEPWKIVERQFNICCLAADLVTAVTKGAWTMHKCMELFSKEPEIVKRTTVDSPSHATPSSTQDAPARLPLVLKPPTTPASAENVASPSSTARPSIFGAGRPREEVLKERNLWR